MKVLLDTDAYSALKRGHGRLVDLVRKSETIFLSTVVVGELLYGFRCGSRFDRNLKELNSFVENPFVEVVSVTLATSDRFARIASALKSKGKPIPTNDIWIAAHAMETGADLVSFDRHYEWIDGLAWVPLSADD